MIDAGGPDHLSVGVRIPRGGFQRPISNRYLYVIPPGRVQCFLLVIHFIKKRSFTKLSTVFIIANIIEAQCLNLIPFPLSSSLCTTYTHKTK
jgi:hypothetical protein